MLIVVGAFLTSCQSEQEVDGIAVNVKSYNAISDDDIEDTQQIQKAIDYVSAEGGGAVTFPKGVYLIDAIKSIKLRNNVTLQFEEGSTLKALPNNAESYEILEIHNVENVSIQGEVNFIGERDQHQGKTGEWGMGLSIRGSKDVSIKDITIQDCWGDGIYVGSTKQQSYSKNITIENAVIKNNRRQGISIISAINLKVINPVISNTHGTPPASGIDFEPNNPSEFLQNIEIINPSTEKNERYGLLFALSGFSGSKNPVSIEVHKTNRIKDDIGIFIPSDLKGHIKIGKEYVLRKPE